MGYLDRHVEINACFYHLLDVFGKACVPSFLGSPCLEEAVHSGAGVVWDPLAFGYGASY